MERIIIFRNTVTGKELTMPVTPSSYPMAAGRSVDRLDMAQTGQVAFPGLKTLFSENLEVMLPARAYPFCTAGAVADPSYYLELLTSWSNSGDVCRYIVTGAGINVPVLLGPISFGEKDGSNDVYATIPLYEYRYLDEVVVETTQNSSRPPGGAVPVADTWTVKRGDTLSAICKTVYGDSSLAYKLATANGIKNPNLIQVGQVLTLPTKAVLTTLSATYATAQTKPSTSAKPVATPAETATASANVRATLGLSPKNTMSILT